MARRSNSPAGSRGERPADRAVYVISVAAELAGVHPQTLRMYERKGLLQPERTSGNNRRYSDNDVQTLREIQKLTQDIGVNLAGVRMIMELRDRLDRMESQMNRARRRMAEMERQAESRHKRSSWGAMVRLADVKNIFEEPKWIPTS
ncbi:MAG: heat shock protein transcriptional repressor HspR [Acidimicrobiia bacterium]